MEQINENVSVNENISENVEKQPILKSNLHAMLLNRNKKPLSSKNTIPKTVSTPSNVKRLQVNKWFNSPTDNMFSPCSKKLYKKSTMANHFEQAKSNLTDELSLEDPVSNDSKTNNITNE